MTAEKNDQPQMEDFHARAPGARLPVAPRRPRASAREPSPARSGRADRRRDTRVDPARRLGQAAHRVDALGRGGALPRWRAHGHRRRGGARRHERGPLRAACRDDDLGARRARASRRERGAGHGRCPGGALGGEGRPSRARRVDRPAGVGHRVPRHRPRAHHGHPSCPRKRGWPARSLDGSAGLDEAFLVSDEHGVVPASDAPGPRARRLAEGYARSCSEASANGIEGASEGVIGYKGGDRLASVRGGHHER